jgi:hypothetical protein
MSKVSTTVNNPIAFIKHYHKVDFEFCFLMYYIFTLHENQKIWVHKVHSDFYKGRAWQW